MKKYKTPIVILIMAVVLIASLYAFPILGYSIEMGYNNFNWHRRHLNSFILFCIFISMWVSVLFISIKIKSKLLFNTYYFYWLAVTIFIVFILTVSFLNIEFFYAPVYFLFIILYAPIFGVISLLAGIILPDALVMVISVLIPLGMFRLGFYKKRKFFKKEIANE
jgi:hypothetical protein